MDRKRHKAYSLVEFLMSDEIDASRVPCCETERAARRAGLRDGQIFKRSDGRLVCVQEKPIRPALATPFALELYRRHLRGDTVENLSLELGIPKERIQLRIRAAAAHIESQMGGGKRTTRLGA